jgi:SAM-dependent methyltransferase
MFERSDMNRADWIKEKRREAEERYDTRWAPLYGEKFGLYDNATHQQFIQKFLGLLTEPAAILDAACGAGRYMPMLLERNHSVFGIDQSQGMLSRAREKFPTVQLEKVGLQEFNFHEKFDGAICMDAMEHLFPEDWIPVLGNFHRALKPGGYFYFTVEIADESEIEEAFIKGQQLGYPIVHGELAHEEVYHYYPSVGQVRDWIQQAGFEMVEEGKGNGYCHFIVRKVSMNSEANQDASA